MDKPNLTVLVSGDGTTLDHLCRCCYNGSLHANINCVISNRKDEIGAESVVRLWNTAYDNRQISYFSVPRSTGDSIYKWSKALLGITQFYHPDLIILAGFTRKLHVSQKFRNRILNIHPSLLPEFGGNGMYGLRVHRAVLEAKKEKTGCTVHIVTNRIDEGRIIAQREVDVLKNDTPESLQERVKEAEKELYPIAIQEYLNKRRLT